MEGLLEKRIIDMTGAEFMQLSKAAFKEATHLPEYVEKDEKDKLLGCRPGTLSSSKACQILKWGKDNNYLVRKRGGSLWNREDLNELSTAYYKSI